MRKIAVLYAGSSHQYRSFTEPKYQPYIAQLLYLPKLASIDLNAFDVLIVPSQIHQEMVTMHMEQIHAFLNSGRIVVALGAQHQSWFEGHHWEFRPTNFWWWREPEAKSGLVLSKPEHDLFRYITLEDATWHYHGVFFPRHEVESLIEIENDGSIMYIDKTSTSGTLVLTTLDPEYHFGSYFMPATERFLDGFLPWLANGQI
ncbi:hypothetical protein DFQ01_105131 [Paenibacillus cellulosilyticus]|uniref:Glutamine amidotransferase n=1 Tax=Paenibacillus cellulosilyticus TaxID=375489 RepID=A0A2V2YV95_9BACL|nr:hypothetical protein [Paenibacillus cellulosilyticus]PWW05147.1 hypothetical protein DFQ01_105131 [Paenibacillus cellulosilyticus]QKS48689.1 hypothetical protein HUB94_31325 [Paenibacillus cellulosilyticus]